MIKRTYKGVEYIGLPDMQVEVVRREDREKYENCSVCNFCSLKPVVWNGAHSQCAVVRNSRHPMACNDPRELIVWMTPVDHAAFALGEPTLYE